MEILIIISWPIQYISAMFGLILGFMGPNGKSHMEDKTINQYRSNNGPSYTMLDGVAFTMVVFNTLKYVNSWLNTVIWNEITFEHQYLHMFG